MNHQQTIPKPITVVIVTTPKVISTVSNIIPASLARRINCSLSQPIRLYLS